MPLNRRYGGIDYTINVPTTLSSGQELFLTSVTFPTQNSTYLTGYTTFMLRTPFNYETDPQIIDDLYIHPFLAAQQRQNDVYDWNRFRFD